MFGERCDRTSSELKEAYKYVSHSNGFTQRRSRLTNLLKFLKEVTAYFDEGSPVDVLYLDFRKAFDTNGW